MKNLVNPKYFRTFAKSFVMAKGKVKVKSPKTSSNRPHPMPRKAGVGRGRGYDKGGKLCK